MWTLTSFSNWSWLNNNSRFLKCLNLSNLFSRNVPRGKVALKRESQNPLPHLSSHHGEVLNHRKWSSQPKGRSRSQLVTLSLKRSPAPPIRDKGLRQQGKRDSPYTSCNMMKNRPIFNNISNKSSKLFKSKKMMRTSKTSNNNRKWSNRKASSIWWLHSQRMKKMK